MSRKNNPILFEEEKKQNPLIKTLISIATFFKELISLFFLLFKPQPHICSNCSIPTPPCKPCPICDIIFCKTCLEKHLNKKHPHYLKI